MQVCHRSPANNSKETVRRIKEELMALDEQRSGQSRWWQKASMLNNSAQSESSGAFVRMKTANTQSVSISRYKSDDQVIIDTLFICDCDPTSRYH